MATADPDLDPTELNEPGATGGDDGDDTLYLSPIATKTSTTRVDPDMEEETSFTGDNLGETVPLIEEMEVDQDEAWAKIRARFPKVDTSKFTAGLNQFKQVVVKLIRKGSVPYEFFKGDEVNDRLPDTIKNSLGPSAAEIVEANDGQIAKKKGALTKLKERLRFHRDKPLKTPEEERQIEDLERQVGEQEREIGSLEEENEQIQERMSLRERVKAIFKKYGFTAFAVVSAVSVVIGVIVSNLSKALSKLGKGVGDGLKTIGKKLGEILPGMVGAIVSFLFKTAGEVVSFLGKNAWLLIVAVVVYLVEQLKKRHR